MSEDFEYEYVSASLNTQSEKENIFKKSDPFNQDWESLKNLLNIEQNFKRRTARNVSKAVETYSSAIVTQSPAPTESYLASARASQVGDGAGSKTINPGTVYRNGYGIFDVITPPYNLYELANFYDTSFANHAAIDAKVENVVGLGYRFEMNSKTMMKLSSATDEAAVERARKRIERLKIETKDWLESLNSDESFTDIMEKIYTDVQATGNGYMEIGRKVNGEIGYIGHIPSTTVRVRRLRDGFVQIIGPSLVYFRNFGAKNKNPLTADPRPNEIIHFKEYSPLNTYYGVPDIIAALPSLIGDQLASQYNIDYFENKAVPRYVITVKGAKL